MADALITVESFVLDLDGVDWAREPDGSDRMVSCCGAYRYPTWRRIVVIHVQYLSPIQLMRCSCKRRAS